MQRCYLVDDGLGGSHGTPIGHETVSGGDVDPTTDCGKFANIVESLANGASSVADFMDKMARMFLGQPATAEGLMNSNSNPSGLMSSGFRPEFSDNSPQPRHFTGGYIAGYLFGPLGASGMGLNERWGLGHISPNENEKADIALNAVSTALGARATPSEARTVRVSGYRKEMTTEKVIPANLGYKDLANQIRKRVCVQKK
ncbi:MAG: hypothetical protein LC113_13025 [Acidobacteria bacterium]|nr:hypothetical protein [Acidobacteriota bacterium]